MSDVPSQVNRPNSNLRLKAFVGVIIVLALGVIGWWFFKQPSPAPMTQMEAPKLKVYASFYPLGFFAKEVGGDLADVTTVTPAGGEPHDYEPSPKEIADLLGADVFIANGGGLEAWAAEPERELKNADKQVLVMEDHITMRDISGEEALEIGSAKDPHIWLDPVRAEQEVVLIRDAFSAADPSHAAAYASNAETTIAELETLDQNYQDGLAACEKHDILTAHDAFHYLAARYNLVVHSIAGISPDEEPSPKALADLTQVARDTGINVVFFEELVSPTLAQTLAQEVGARTLPLNPLEGLTDAEIAAGDNYFTVMRANLNNLRDALVCQ